MATTYRRKPTKAEIRRQQMEELVMFPIDWLEERSGLIGGVKYFLFRNVPSDINWMQTLGSAALTAFLVQAITGVILAMYYVPSADINPRTGKPIAWESIVNITDHLTLGWLVRGMHRWGASVFIILMFLHMGRVFLFGAYKYPRELNWIIGVLHPRDRDDGGLHRLPPAVGPDRVLGDRRRHQPQRDGAVLRPLASPVPTRRPGDQRRDADALLLAAHARSSRARSSA